MKTLLNILPPEKKKDLLLARRYHTILLREASVLFLVFFLGTLLLGVWGLLVFNERTMVKNLEEKKQKDIFYSDIAFYEKTFSRVQELVPKVESVLRDQRVDSRVLRSLEESVPSIGMIDSIIISEGGMKVAGRAETRENLLEFQDLLRSQSCFSDIVLPWSQMAKKENVDFEITITVRPECFAPDKL